MQQKLKIRQAVSFWLWCLPCQQNAWLTLCLPHRAQGTVAVWGLEGFGQCLGTRVLKDLDFNVHISPRAWIFRRALLLDSGLLGNAGVSSGCLQWSRQRLAYGELQSMEWSLICSPWSALSEGTLPKQQSQAGCRHTWMVLCLLLAESPLGTMQKCHRLLERSRGLKIHLGWKTHPEWRSQAFYY